MKIKQQHYLTDAVGRIIRVGDWIFGSYQSRLMGCTVTKITKKIIFSTRGRWFPDRVIVSNEVPLKDREPLQPSIIEKYGKINLNTDQLEIEVIEEKEESSNVSEDSSNRVWGDRIIFGPTPRQTN